MPHTCVFMETFTLGIFVPVFIYNNWQYFAGEETANYLEYCLGVSLFRSMNGQQSKYNRAGLAPKSMN